MKRLIALFALVALAGCGEEPVATAQTDNARVQLQTLFTHEGCTVYRFWDDGRRYFVRCTPGENVSTMQSNSCGKNCVHRSTIQTVQEEKK